MRATAFPGHGLYAITDGPRPDLLQAATAALDGGAQLLQYRDKTTDHIRRQTEASALLKLCKRYGTPLIINDDIELAHAIGAHGVHLGESDGDIEQARATLGATAIIGVSCYDSLERAQSAATAGASYIAFGAFFSSPTKPFARRASPALLTRTANLGIPRVAIGGITPDNGGSLVDAGAEYLAVISAVFGATNIRAAAERFAHLYSNHRVAS